MRCQYTPERVGSSPWVTSSPRQPGITPGDSKRGVGVPTHGPLGQLFMKAILGLLAVVSSSATILASASPAAAQLFFPSPNRPTYSFTPSYTNVRYNVYRVPSIVWPSSGYRQPSYQRRRGYGHYSGDYFGW